MSLRIPLLPEYLVAVGLFVYGHRGCCSCGRGCHSTRDEMKIRKAIGVFGTLIFVLILIIAWCALLKDGIWIRFVDARSGLPMTNVSVFIGRLYNPPASSLLPARFRTPWREETFITTNGTYYLKRPSTHSFVYTTVYAFEADGYDTEVRNFHRDSGFEGDWASQSNGSVIITFNRQ
jgi:hypothetical protein